MKCPYCRAPSDDSAHCVTVGCGNSAQPVIHEIKYASQPDLQFRCDGTWSTPAWKTAEQLPVLPTGCYWSDDGRAYTFEITLATCQACKEAEATASQTKGP